MVTGSLGSLHHLDTELDEVKEEKVSPTKTKILKLKANQI